MNLIIDNNLRAVYATPDYLLQEYTKTDQEITVNQTSIDLINANGFEQDDYVYIGEVGAERSEITKINSLSGNTIYVDALTQPQDKKIRVFNLKYNQLQRKLCDHNTCFFN